MCLHKNNTFSVQSCLFCSLSYPCLVILLFILKQNCATKMECMSKYIEQHEQFEILPPIGMAVRGERQRRPLRNRELKLSSGIHLPLPGDMDMLLFIHPVSIPKHFCLFFLWSYKDQFCNQLKKIVTYFLYLSSCAVNCIIKK